MLTNEDITRFQELYRREFGIEINKEDAHEKGAKLLRLMSIVYKPMSTQEYGLIQKHRKETFHLLEQRITKI